MGWVKHTDQNYTFIYSPGKSVSYDNNKEVNLDMCQAIGKEYITITGTSTTIPGIKFYLTGFNVVWIFKSEADRDNCYKENLCM